MLVLITIINGYGQISKPVLTDNTLKTFIDSAVQKAAIIYLQDSNANGISIGVYINGEKHTYNYGEVKKGSNKLPTADTYYGLGSIDKTFATILLAQAVVEKKLS